MNKSLFVCLWFIKLIFCCVYCTFRIWLFISQTRSKTVPIVTTAACISADLHGDPGHTVWRTRSLKAASCIQATLGHALTSDLRHCSGSLSNLFPALIYVLIKDVQSRAQGDWSVRRYLVHRQRRSGFLQYPEFCFRENRWEPNTVPRDITDQGARSRTTEPH